MNVSSADIALALRLAETAGEVLRQHFRTALPVERKMDASPVTLADHAAEEAMRALLEEARPKDGIFGEEGERIRPTAKRQWVLDPIDGTRSFIAGYPLFTVLVSLVVEEIPVLGVIHQPILKETWVGIKGKPTTLNGTIAKVRGGIALESATLATTSIDHFNEVERESFIALQQKIGRTVLGGDAYAYAMLASGQLDMVMDAGLKPYDFCAIAPIITGAGGRITDWQGKALTLHSKGQVLASANPEWVA